MTKLCPCGRPRSRQSKALCKACAGVAPAILAHLRPAPRRCTAHPIVTTGKRRRCRICWNAYKRRYRRARKLHALDELKAWVVA